MKETLGKRFRGGTVKVDEKKCPRCAEVIKKDALICKHCGHEFSASEIADQRAIEAKAKKNGMVGCASILGILLLIAMCSSGGSKHPAANTSDSSTAGTPAFTAEQARALEAANKVEIAAKLKEAKAIPATDVDGNARIYTELVHLAPANPTFIEKRDKFVALSSSGDDSVAMNDAFADNPEQALQISKFSWEKGGFDSVQLVHLTVKNNAQFAIKDFTLECKHQGSSGTDMDENTQIIYELVPAKSSKRIKEVNMGFIKAQVVSSSCTITNAVRA